MSWVLISMGKDSTIDISSLVVIIVKALSCNEYFGHAIARIPRIREIGKKIKTAGNPTTSPVSTPTTTHKPAPD
jgi:hypothetical protein